jgi:hypothetical protein
MILTTLTVLSIGAYVFDPQNVIWNERLVPFWFITIHLSAGWLFGYVLMRWAKRPANRLGHFVVQIGETRFSFAHEGAGAEDVAVPMATSGGGDGSEDTFVASSYRDENEPVEDADTRWQRRGARATVVILILGLLTTVPGLIPPVASALSLNTTGNQVSSWAQWNYSGYQAKPAWPEYNDLMTTMAAVGKEYGCGRAMWEYNADQNRFGTPEALMLMPYWTNNCIDSMEGLYFESSATTPYHFLDQAELSVSPSDPMVGLPYGGLDVAFGVEHLQMLGVRYYVAFSPAVIKQANADPALTLIAKTKKWPSPGDQWFIYKIAKSPIVVGLTSLPNIVANTASRVGWLQANTTWWLNPRLWGTVAATTGPSNWPTATSVSTMDMKTKLPKVTVSDVKVGLQSISFHVSRIGVPVLVKISYFPRWHATGATGPYRVSPNLMVVIPTTNDVSMVYGSTPLLTVSNIITDLVALAGAVTLFFYVRRRVRTRHEPRRKDVAL